MVKRFFIELLLITNCTCGVSASYTGRVFVDNNGNYQYDKGEKVISGVSVSDGLNVVQTDNDGTFDLPGHADERFIFITIPSGYRINTYYLVDLADYNLKAWLYDHWHVNHMYTYPDNGVGVICSSTPVYGGIDHASSAFCVMNIDGKGDFTSDFHYSYMDKHMVIASIQNHQAPITPEGTISLVVNTYSTASSITRVRYSSAGVALEKEVGHHSIQKESKGDNRKVKSG